ncbi:PKD domain-containing protein [Neolewinella antarctica]|uniref:PKD/Chitinase domain-containing protein n=1 Tax=Neolewinella antarctica TaxID=442734 RepID=A0ABX0XAJ5_9BACT|nr:PKD domain-containing protein [Neolewinella antarctica]NJC26247.1 hypothetical protein [Neolewinella antarctica]
MKFSHLFIFLFAFTFVSCDDDDDLIPNISDVAAPSELSLDFSVAPDNSGRVTLRPNGRGVTLFRVDFGDAAVDTLAEVSPGSVVDYVYTEGSYTVTVEAMGINGLTTSVTEEIMVSFAAPENLDVTIDRVPGNAFGIAVSATADLEANFSVTFGDEEDEEPIFFTEDTSIVHVYDEVGNYEVRVVAFSGGTATTETTTTVSITNPVLLPVTFEEVEPEFVSFGGGFASVIDNPDVSDGNSSARVAQLNRSAGSEVFAASFIELGEPIDFSTLTKIRIKSWSPTAGTPVTMKLENAANGDIFIELEQTSTVASQWEEITFDFVDQDLTREYSKIVLFYNLGTSGNDENYYYDDIEQTSGLAAITLPLDFEQSVDYVFTSFGGAGASVIDNPDVSDGNGSAKVMEFRKGVGSETFGGSFIDLDQAVNFTNGQTVKLKVWSPKIGAEIRIKMENTDNADENIEIFTTTTTSNQWEEVTLDFSGAESLNNLRRIVFFGDFGFSGTDEAYYFDDLRVE